MKVISAESMNLNYMGGTFSISYDHENEIYRVFQENGWTNDWNW